VKKFNKTFTSLFWNYPGQ